MSDQPATPAATPTAAPSSDLLKAFERVRQAVESLSSAKSPEFYVQMARWLVQTSHQAAALFNALPIEAGAVERMRASQSLDELCAVIVKMLTDFHDPALSHDEVRKSMDAIPPKIAEVSRHMTQALAATAGYAVADEDISLDEARDRFVKAMGVQN